MYGDGAVASHTFFSVFITDLKLVDIALLVRDENGHCYSVELKIEE